MLKMANVPGHRCAATAITLALAAFAAASLPAQAVENSTVTDEIIVWGKGYGSNVAGTKTLVPLRETPNTVTVIDRERIELQNLVTLEDLATQTVGITVTGVSSENPSFLSRGFSIDNYLIDGVPGIGGVAFPAVVPDLFLYERVEVLRGPAGLFSGSGSPAGSINLVRKRPLDEARISGSVGYGSWDNYRAEVDISQPLTADGSIKARVGALYHDQDQFYDVAHRRRQLAYGVVEFDLTTDTTLTTGGHYENFKPAIQTGLPGYRGGGLLDVRRSTYLGADWNRLESDVWQAYAELRHDFGGGWVGRVTGQYTDIKRDDVYAYIGSQPVTPTNGWTNHIDYLGLYESDLWSVDANAVGSIRAFGRDHDVVVGGDYQRRGYDNLYGRTSNITRIDVFNPNNAVDEHEIPLNGGTSDVTEQYGVYGQTRIKPLDGTTLVLGGRLSWWDYETVNIYPTRGTPTGYSEKGEFTPYFGLVQDLASNVSAYVSYADIFTPQSQRTADGKQIDPMSGRQLEGGIKTNVLDDRLLLSAAIYRIEQTNRAYADPDNTGFYLALGEVESKGIELEANGRLTDNWTINAGYALNKNKYKRDATASNEGQSAQPVIPKHSFKLFTNYSVTEGMLDGLSLGGGVNWLSETEGGLPASRVASGIGTLVEQDSYAVFSLRAGYKINENVSVNANLENAFDKVYYARISATGRGNFYGTPRNFHLSIKATY